MGAGALLEHATWLNVLLMAVSMEAFRGSSLLFLSLVQRESDTSIEKMGTRGDATGRSERRCDGRAPPRGFVEVFLSEKNVCKTFRFFFQISLFLLFSLRPLLAPASLSLPTSLFLIYTPWLRQRRSPPSQRVRRKSDTRGGRRRLVFLLFLLLALLPLRRRRPVVPPRAEVLKRSSLLLLVLRFLLYRSRRRSCEGAPLPRATAARPGTFRRDSALPGSRGCAAPWRARRESRARPASLRSRPCPPAWAGPRRRCSPLDRPCTVLFGERERERESFFFLCV